MPRDVTTLAPALDRASDPDPRTVASVARPDGGPLLAVEGLSIVTSGGAGGGSPLVDGIDLELARGEALGLVGESGSGKTLTCRAVLGALPAGAEIGGGRIEFDGHDLRTIDARRWRRLRGARIGAIFQDPGAYLDPSIPVGRQLAEVLRVVGGHGRRAARTRAHELLDAVGLRPATEIATRIPSHLSGGMQQRAMIALAIACDPDLLVADEPTTALDALTQSEIVSLLDDLRASRGLALLFVSHDLRLVTALCDRIAVFRDGRIVEQRPTADIVADPRHPYTRSLLASAGLGDVDA